MLKKSLSALALTLSLGLSSMAFSDEPVKVEAVAESQQDVPMHINQKNLDVLVSGLLKDSGQNWKMRTKLEGKKDHKRAPSTTYVYSPEDNQDESFSAFIGAPKQDFFKRSDEAIKETMQKMYPGAKLTDFKVLQKDDNSMLVEWTTENISDPDLKTHTWVRSVNSDEGLVFLQYTTEDMSKVDSMRKVWVPLLEHVAVKDNAIAQKAN